MKINLIRLITGLSYIWLIRLTWEWLHGDIDWQLASGCLAVSTLWLGLTEVTLHKRLQAFYDNFARLSITVPIFLGAALSVAGFFTATNLGLHAYAVALLAGWAGVYASYRLTRKRYETAGHGLLPEGAWINPPAEVYEDGDITLTAGFVATDLRNSVGHGEVTVVDYSQTPPKFASFSSYMGTGAVISDLADIANPARESGLYIVMRPIRPLTAAQKAAGYALAQAMCEQNAIWRQETQARVDWLFDHLPFNQTAFMVKLRAKCHVSGYDWLGLVNGRVAPDHWICIVAALEHSRRRSIKTARYGLGLLGLGTGWFDATNPDFVLSDPNYRLLSIADQRTWQAKKAAPVSAGK
jgi:hypothetical protein